MLFEHVFPRFRAAGRLPEFLRALEPHICNDSLPAVAPEAMQALVQHFSASGELHRVERCVLHMDIMSLDLDQVC